MSESTEKKTPRYNGIPKQVSRKDFNEDILPHLSKRIKGPKPKLSFYKIFNYILYVLHTGIQWNQLRTRRNELHWSNVYKWHSRWSKDGSYEKLFEASVITCLIPTNLTLLVFMEMGQIWSSKKGRWHRIFRTQTPKR